MTRSSAIDIVSAYFDEGRFQSELADLVAYETESQNPEQGIVRKIPVETGVAAS